MKQIVSILHRILLKNIVINNVITRVYIFGMIFANIVISRSNCEASERDVLKN